MKLLYFGDKHERVTKPESRLDSNYKETEVMKTREIIEIGKKHNVKAYLQPGDFFDAPNPPLNYVADVIKEWSNFNLFGMFTDLLTGKESPNEFIEKLNNFTPLVGVVGNHELYGNNLNSLPSTMIGFLNKIGIMNFATKENPYIIEGKNGFKVAITGTHYHLDIDKEGFEEDYIVREKLGDIHIHIVHGMLTDTSKGNLYDYTLIDDIAPHTKADLTIAGHDHIGFPLTEVDGKYFVNPGAIMRNSSDVKEMKRKPKVLLINIDESTGEMKLEEIYLQSAKDGHEILSREKIERQRSRELQLAGFYTSVKQANVQKGLDLEQILKNISTNKQVSDDVVADLLDMTAAKRIEMNENVDGYAKDVQVERVVIENFQSHTYTDIPLDKHMNVFIGNSGNGKSAIQRVFRWIYANQPSGKRIIQRGKDYARGTVYLSNGMRISRIIERKNSGKNGFEVYDPKTNETSYFNTTYLPEVQKMLGLKPYVLDKDKIYLMNFMKQGTGWFMLDSSDRERAKIIGGVYHSHIADAVSREMENKNRKTLEQIKEKEATLVSLDETMEKYKDLESEKQLLNDLKSRMNVYEATMKKVEHIKKLIQEREDSLTKLKAEQTVISKLNHLNDVQVRLSQLKTNCLLHDVKVKAVTNYAETLNRFSKLRKTIEETKNIDSAFNVISKIKEMMQKAQSISSVLLERDTIRSKLANIHLGLEQTKRLDEAEKRLKALTKENFVRYEKLSNDIPKVIAKQKELENTSKKFGVLQTTIVQTAKIEEAFNRINKLKTLQRKAETIRLNVKNYEDVKAKLDNTNDEIKKATDYVAKQEYELKNILDELGTCPFCKQSVSGSLVHVHS